MDINNKLDNIYTEEFFEAIKLSEVESSVECMKIVTDYFNSKSIVDLGCGCGIYLKALDSLGFEDIIGFDGSQNAVTTSLLPDKTFIFDLRNSLDLGKKYDLAICIEVAEHLESQFAEILVKTLTECSNNIFFTAAVPNQGGLDHCNEQPNEYWINIFEKYGFEYLKEDTLNMRKEMTDKNIIWWISQNLMLFKK